MLDDIICSVDESVDFRELHKCEVCGAIASGDRMFNMHKIFCAEEQSMRNLKVVERSIKSNVEIPRTTVDCNRVWCGIGGYLCTRCS